MEYVCVCVCVQESFGEGGKEKFVFNFKEMIQYGELKKKIRRRRFHWRKLVWCCKIIEIIQ